MISESGNPTKQTIHATRYYYGTTKAMEVWNADAPPMKACANYVPRVFRTTWWYPQRHCWERRSLRADCVVALSRTCRVSLPSKIIFKNDYLWDRWWCCCWWWVQSETPSAQARKKESEQTHTQLSNIQWGDVGCQNFFLLTVNARTVKVGAKWCDPIGSTAMQWLYLQFVRKFAITNRSARKSSVGSKFQRNVRVPRTSHHNFWILNFGGDPSDNVIPCISQNAAWSRSPCWHHRSFGGKFHSCIVKTLFTPAEIAAICPKQVQNVNYHTGNQGLWLSLLFPTPIIVHIDCKKEKQYIVHLRIKIW